MKKNALIFGKGLVFKLIINDVMEKYNVIAIIDNDESKVGLFFDGMPVIKPQSIYNEKYDIIVLASSRTIEMASQLKSMGVSIEVMEIGANYALNKYYCDNNKVLDFYIDDSLKISEKNSCNGLVCVNFGNTNKRILFDQLSINTLLGLCGENDRLPNYFALAEKYYGTNKGLFVDVGANIGTSSLEAVDNNQVTEVISFEPSSSNFALLMSNIYINRLQDRIHAYNFAVGDKGCSSQLFLSAACSGDNRLRTVDVSENLLSEVDLFRSVEKVSTVTLDDFLYDKLEEIRFLWIDVQGYEYYVLLGCKKLLSLGNIAIQIEYWPMGLRETKTIDLLNKFLVDCFDYFIDMNEYSSSNVVLHEIKDIYNIERILKNYGDGAHTDLFLINSSTRRK